MRDVEPGTRHEYRAQGRNGYGAIDLYRINPDGTEDCMENEMSGPWLRQKHADWITASLNRAYAIGRRDESCHTEES